MSEIEKHNVFENEIEAIHECEHEGYEYYKKLCIKKGNANQCKIGIYEVPPMKSAYPYHYHLKNEETFYIISGEGIIKTPTGDITVKAGDIIFFPADKKGAHKITNPSKTERLLYIDFDTKNNPDVCFYPDSNKVGIWSSHFNKAYKIDQDVDYYEGE